MCKIILQSVVADVSWQPGMIICWPAQFTVHRVREGGTRRSPRINLLTVEAGSPSWELIIALHCPVRSLPVYICPSCHRNPLLPVQTGDVNTTNTTNATTWYQEYLKGSNLFYFEVTNSLISGNPSLRMRSMVVYSNILMFPRSWRV